MRSVNLLIKEWFSMLLVPPPLPPSNVDKPLYPNPGVCVMVNSQNCCGGGGGGLAVNFPQIVLSVPTLMTCIVGHLLGSTVTHILESAMLKVTCV